MVSHRCSVNTDYKMNGTQKYLKRMNDPDGEHNADDQFPDGMFRFEKRITI